MTQKTLAVLIDGNDIVGYTYTSAKNGDNENVAYYDVNYGGGPAL